MKVYAYDDETGLYTTTYTAITTQKTLLLKFACPDRMRYSLLSGIPFIIKLYDTGGANEMEGAARIFLGVKIPSQETPIEIKEFNYAPFKAVTAANQANKNYQEALRIDIPQGKVTIKEEEELWIEIKGTIVAGWASGDGSQIEFEMIPSPM